MKEEIMEIALKRGFLIPSNEIYGQVSGFYDYGSIGEPMKHKIEEAWRNFFVRRDGLYEVETVLILPEIVLKASGHVGQFGDPFVECINCRRKFRADTLIADEIEKKAKEAVAGERIKRLKEHLARLPGMKPEEMNAKLR